MPFKLRSRHRHLKLLLLLKKKSQPDSTSGGSLTLQEQIKAQSVTTQKGGNPVVGLTTPGNKKTGQSQSGRANLGRKKAKVGTSLTKTKAGTSLTRTKAGTSLTKTGKLTRIGNPKRLGKASLGSPKTNPKTSLGVKNPGTPRLGQEKETGQAKEIEKAVASLPVPVPGKTTPGLMMALHTGHSHVKPKKKSKRQK